MAKDGIPELYLAGITAEPGFGWLPKSTTEFSNFFGLIKFLFGRPIETDSTDATGTISFR